MTQKLFKCIALLGVFLCLGLTANKDNEVIYPAEVRAVELISATYGYSPLIGKAKEIDVTRYFANQERHQLGGSSMAFSIPANPNAIFGDPAPGKVKEVTITVETIGYPPLGQVSDPKAKRVSKSFTEGQAVVWKFHGLGW